MVANSTYIKALIRSAEKFEYEEDEEPGSETPVDAPAEEALVKIPVPVQKSELAEQYFQYGYKRPPSFLYLVTYADEGRAKRARQMQNSIIWKFSWGSSILDLYEVNRRHLVLVRKTPDNKLYASCTCMDFAFGRSKQRACKHVTAVIVKHYLNASYYGTKPLFNL